ncbi:hypothetical protein [Micromonospora sp. WMMD736]|uniref:hypothetical protein n=1 Tax=Micromonospora sp. WMMD736 TaxID=3404112 RepID=UPI003B955585
MVALEQVAAQLQQESPERYGSEAGATIGQSWNYVYTLFAIPMVCLLVDGRPPAGADTIPTVVTLSRQEMMGRLSEMVALDGFGSLAFVHDGRSGHAVTLVGYDPAVDRYQYHDPWPGDSLLCLHQNAAGVDAQPAGKLWSVTSTELASVLVGLLVLPSTWERVNGRPGPVRYAELTATDFWTFFGLQERHRGKDDAGQTRIEVEPGNFADSVALSFHLDDRGQIVRATLALRESWALSEPYGVNPLGLDIARHFLATLSPQADTTAAAGLSRGLDLGFVRDKFRDPAFQATPPGQLLITYLGGQPDVTLIFRLSALHVERRGEPPEQWITLVIDTF